MIPTAVTSRSSPSFAATVPLPSIRRLLKYPHPNLLPHGRRDLFSPSHTVRKSIDLLSRYLPFGRDARICQSGSNRERENHNHLFFLNHHTVNPVASNVIAIAISYPYFHLSSWIPSKFIPYQVPTIIMGVEITVMRVSSLIMSPV